MYFWLKLAHIAAMMIWFAGLLMLPRLFVARDKGRREGRGLEFNLAANTLYFRVMTPAAIIAVALGMSLIAYGPGGAWLVMKLVLVALAVLIHLYLGLSLYRLGSEEQRHGSVVFRALGWAVLLILLGIAALTGAKPDTVGDLPPPPRGEAGLPTD